MLQTFTSEKDGCGHRETKAYYEWKNRAYQGLEFFHGSNELEILPVQLNDCRNDSRLKGLRARSSQADQVLITAGRYGLHAALATPVSGYTGSGRLVGGLLSIHIEYAELSSAPLFYVKYLKQLTSLPSTCPLIDTILTRSSSLSHHTPRHLSSPVSYEGARRPLAHPTLQSSMKALPSPISYESHGLL